MESNEYRKGNLLKGGVISEVNIVCFGNSTTPCQVSIIENVKGSHEPMPLTTELMNTLGTKVNDEEWKIGEKFGIRRELHPERYVCTFENKDLRLLLFIHELQNIYFSIFAEELDITKIL